MGKDKDDITESSDVIEALGNPDFVSPPFTTWQKNNIIISEFRDGGMAMIIKPSVALRNNFSAVSTLAKETKEPIYITVNGEGDGVYMNMEAFERREQMLNLREKIMQAEEERLRGERTMCVTDARKALKERLNALQS